MKLLYNESSLATTLMPFFSTYIYDSRNFDIRFCTWPTLISLVHSGSSSIRAQFRASQEVYYRAKNHNQNRVLWGTIFPWIGLGSTYSFLVGDESRARAVYAKLESNSEPERARVCQRVAVRASESQ